MRRSILMFIWVILFFVCPALAQADTGKLSPQENLSAEGLLSFENSFVPDPELANLLEERLLARAEIFFPYAKGGGNNVFNSGVAANYANGTVLEPGQEFSYNQVVGIRDTHRGFIIGANIWNVPQVGGGVCRTSTVIYQAAKQAGFEILERHPHSLPVNYAASGMDATVNWGVKDLRFINNSPDFVTLYTQLDEEEAGRKLWAEFKIKVPRKLIEAVVIREIPEDSLWQTPEDTRPTVPEDTRLTTPENTRLTALLQNSTSFLPGEQLAELLTLSCHTEEKSYGLEFTTQLNEQKITFREGTKAFYVDNQEKQLSDTPLSIKRKSGEINLWIPVRDWTRLTGTEVIWLDGNPPRLLLNLSGVYQEDREELEPDR